ncbi:GNAT family N-acetyltransferase [Ottowia thiooxydans]|uniref:Ribosomal protein S18 acetylase RimI-like enzyme n=1 Tax=Ottowia thiooxydans TaxID=219182 RepID=A0ABV2Q337_9BURK
MQNVETTFSPETDDLLQISRAVISHDRATIGARSPQPLACLAREDGRLIGGAAGRIEVGRLYVEYLWVDVGHRGKGLGARLLQDIEEAAKRTGCTEFQIESLSDSAASMYRRAGYQTRAQIDNYIPGLTLQIHLKYLT